MDDELREKKELMRNLVIMGFSMVIIAAVTIAVVAKTDGSTQGAGTMKTLLSVCSKTEHPENCIITLKHMGQRATAMDYLKGSINATRRELVVVDMPKPEFVRDLPLLQSQSYRDCLELLHLGTEELDSLYAMADSAGEISKMNLDDAMNSLAAVISYQQTCSDELLQTNSYEVLGYSLKIPIILARITLAMVDNLSGLAKVELPYKPSSRRVLGAATRLGNVNVPEQGGFPTWFSASERKIFESQSRRPNAVVAQDGSGQFKTINESLAACPKKNATSQCVIYVKKGTYEEKVVVPKDVGQVIMYGDGPMNTIVSGFNRRDPKIVTTPFQAATFVVMGKGFICKDMAFIAPPDTKGAPALLVLSDHAAFFNCKIQGEEGSLFAVAQRQFYRDCEIHGTVEIIKGDSAAVIQNSQITVKTRNSSNSVWKKNVVSAQSRVDRHERTGFVIQNCTITAENGSSLASTMFLGTPYKEYSRTIVMESYLGDVIHPEGWCKWSDNYGTVTATFREYNNRGPGAQTHARVGWNGYRTVSRKGLVASYTSGQFIQADQWLPSAEIPYESGFVFQKID